MSAAPDTQHTLLERARRLHDNGWGVLPLPTRSKASPPVGMTGERSEWPTWETYTGAYSAGGASKWGNLGVRMPLSVVGIDIDAYDSKGGADTWASLGGADWPATVRLSGRYGPGYDGTSGIRFYRLPEQIEQGELWGAHDGIEILRFGHRYAVAPGSTHPTGSTYQAFDERTGAFLDTLPPIGQLPVLPVALAEMLTKDGAPWARSKTEAEPRAAREAVMCRRMTGALATAVHDITNGSSRYDRARDAVWEILKLQDEGHSGAEAALEALKGAYVLATASDRRAAGAEPPWSEFDRNVADARRKIEADPTDEMLRACCGPTGDEWPSVGKEGPREALGDRDTAVGPGAGAEGSGGPSVAPEDLRATTAYRRMALDRAARRLLDADEAALAWDPPAPVPVSVLLAEPDEPVLWRVQNLWPAGGKVLLSAAAKSGKTTLGLNLDRSLLTGEPFLGVFETEPIEGTVCVLDIEMTRTQMRQWYRSLDGADTSRAVLLPMRGRAHMLDLRVERVREYWRLLLAAQGCSVLRLDPIGPVLASLGIDENDNGGVASYLAALDTLAVSLGADLMVSHHYGHSGRTRGASALLGWADALWDLRRDGEQDSDDDLEEVFVQPSRTFRAEGRDVDVPERPLAYDPTTRLLSAGETKAAARTRAQAEFDLAVQILREHGLITTREFQERWSEQAKAAGLRTSNGPRHAAYKRASQHVLASQAEDRRYS